MNKKLSNKKRKFELVSKLSKIDKIYNETNDIMNHILYYANKIIENYSLEFSENTSPNIPKTQLNLRNQTQDLTSLIEWKKFLNLFIEEIDILCIIEKNNLSMSFYPLNHILIDSKKQLLEIHSNNNYKLKKQLIEKINSVLNTINSN